jgi:hypothetical protein
MRATATLLLVLAASVQAQTFHVGGHVGRTSAKQHVGDPVSTYQVVHGLSAGAFGRLALTPWLAVQADVVYAQKGARWYSSYEMRLDYLEAPLTVRLASPVPLFGARPYLYSGVAPSVELRCGGYTTPPSILSVYPGPAPVALDCLSQRQRYTDRGTVLGGGVSLQRGRNEVALELRRVRGEDISGYGACCRLRNDVTTLLLGVSRRLR